MVAGQLLLSGCRGKPVWGIFTIALYSWGSSVALSWEGPELLCRNGNSHQGSLHQVTCQGSWIVNPQSELEIPQLLFPSIDLEFIWLSATC